MIRLGATLLWILVAGAAIGQRAANAPAVEDAEVARAMTAAARALLILIRKQRGRKEGRIAIFRTICIIFG